ncbi:LOW QUALITY PROTEIN: potassium channel subfamily U member 1 [Pluvialis apricaria]
MAGEFNLTCALYFQLAFIIPSLFGFLGGLFTVPASSLAGWAYGLSVEKILMKKFGAADDRVRFLELDSLVDFFTIPPVFTDFFSSLSHFLAGLWFLRALMLLELPRILQFLRITKNNYSIKLSKLFAVLISTWLEAAGFIHLVENSGDPWVKPAIFQSLSCFKCMYLVMRTVSTVGDVVVQTTLGQTFTIFFIIGGLVLFAIIPIVVEIVESHKNYKSSYEVRSGKNYIVVCGNTTPESVITFLQELVQDKGNVCRESEILFLGESIPSLELEAVFKCYSAYTIFFYGSALNSEDLKSVGMGSVNACLILADVRSPQPYTEDTSNIIVVLSIKNLCLNMRVILQVIQSCNKVYLPNTPSWDRRTGDGIICCAELKLGFVAQSCRAPGLSTLHLFIVKEDTETKRKYLKDKMLLEDKGYKIMTFQLPNDFADMTFIEVCWFCFVKLNLVLLGTELKFGSQGQSAILINPSAQIKLHQNTVDFFIARSLAEVKRGCDGQGEQNSRVILVSTGMFQWCDAVPLQEALLSWEDQAALNLQDRICCIFGVANLPLIGLQDFAMPLRATNFIYRELKEFFSGSLEYLQREWKNFPKLWLFSGSALSCADLRAVDVQGCAACAILSSKTTASSSPSLVDMESILTTLNIRSMQDAVFRARALGNQSQPCYKRIPITTELSFLTCTSGCERTEPVPNTLQYRALCSECLGCRTRQDDSFGHVYCRALDLFGILCFGLSRLMEEPNLYKTRFGIARSAGGLKTLSMDLQFCGVPFNIATTDHVGCGNEVSYRARKQGWKFEFG